MIKYYIDIANFKKNENMLDKKKEDINNYLDVLLDLKINEKFLLTESQLEYLKNLKFRIKNIEDENILDQIIINITKTINSIYWRIKTLQLQISKEERVFFEEVERSSEREEAMNLINSI